MSQYVRIEEVDDDEPIAGATFYYDIGDDPNQRYVVTGPIINLLKTVSPDNVDFEAAGKAAWTVSAEEKGLIDEGLEWDDVTNVQWFWIEVARAAVTAALGTPLEPQKLEDATEWKPDRDTFIPGWMPEDGPGMQP